ncbi:MAG: OmpH family outer membrane protein [bacterium]
MMRRARLLLAGLLLLIASPRAALAAKDVKIGVIDVPRILEDYEGFRELRKELEKPRTDREQEYTNRARALNKEAQELKDGGKLLSESKRREKETVLMKKAQDLEEWRQVQSKEQQEKEEGLLKRLESDVRKILDQICSAAGYTFVVRKDLLLYVDKDAKDLTNDVLAALRKQSKGR